MKKRSLSLLLAALMVVSCLAGCGATEVKEPEKTEAEAPAEEESAEAVEKEELEEKTIQVMMFGPGKQKDAEKVWSAFNEKLQEYVPNTTVEFTIVPSGEYKEKFNQMLAAGEEVDLAWVGYCSPKQDDLVADGSLMPLNDLLDTYGQDIKEILGDTVLDISTYADGNIYYTISWQGLFAKKMGFFIPKEFAELAGDTWLDDTRKVVADFYASSADGYDADKLEACYKQFEIYFQTLKDNDKLYSGTSGLFGSPQIFNIDDFNFQKNYTGVLKGDNNFKVVDLISTDYFRTYARLTEEFYQKGFVRSDIASIEANSLQFMQKDNTGALTPNALVSLYHNYFSEADVESRTKSTGFEMVGIEIQDNGYLNRGQETSMAIPYCADEPERGMMVLNAIYSEPELYNLLIYGIEDEHYTKNEDGTITVAEKYNTADSNYGLNNWYIGTCLNSYDTQKSVPGYYQGLQELEKNAIVSPLLKFVFDETPVADVASAIKAIDGEYWKKIEQGYSGDYAATLDKWIAEREAAGLEKYIAEFQKQLDAYIQENNITSW